MDNSLQELIAVNPGAVADIAQVLTMLGDPFVILLLVVAVTWRRWMRLSVCIAGAFVVRVVYTVMKESIGRARPSAALQVVHATGYAMPSGHAAGIAFVAVLVTFFHQRWRVHAVAIALVVGWTRVALGVHYPSDVVVGWLVGGALGYACARLALRFERNTISAG